MEDLNSLLEAIGRFEGMSFRKIDFEKLTHYPLVGRGAQGAVFKIAPDRVVKVYKHQEDVETESEVLKAAQESTIVPKLYEIGPKYVIMEYIEGPSLDQYLEANTVMTEELSAKIFFLLKEMKRLNFTRLDARLRHILLSKQGDLKIVDHVNSFIKQSSQPKLMMKELDQLGLLSTFLEHVKKFDPESYNDWAGAVQEIREKSLKELKKDSKKKSKDN
ncbi:kinase [Bacillus sp. Marseille-P3661]|uniref:kinase n=1 Tax=Bacillus sp. Marseille-P3661 TaxID=1936234 RepID=UPI000C81DDB0|nr:kinase [Bacillus sp. Marseille-P3661]